MTVTKQEEEKKEAAPSEEAALKIAGSDPSSPPEVVKEDTEKNDPFSLKVRAEYITNSRPASLPPLPPEDLTQVTAENSGQKAKKKRPRDARIDDAAKVCHRIVRGEECPFGDSCKFSHDIKEFLATRPPDIDEVEGGCPIFHLHGFCPYGVQCRIAKSHTNMATGENLRKEPENPPPPPVMNVLPKDVQRQLWKNKFPFKHKRHFEKKAPKAAEPTESKTDMSPLPTKRKLIDFSNKIYVGKFDD